MRIDLHTHSSTSDGTQPPAELVRAAAQAGLDVVALTDHDTTAGWDEAAAQARADGIQLVRGTEISCSADGISVHLLSYLQDPNAAPLRQSIQLARQSRLERAERMVELLGADLAITWDDVRAQVAEGATIGRPHIADALVASGVVDSREHAFATFLASGGPYYVRHFAPDPVEAVRLVVDAGGVPVMAHPLARLRGRVVDDAVVGAMADAGLAGLEVYHRDNDEDARRHLLGLARDLDLLVTGSSDFHGAGKPNRLGENLTHPDVLAEIERRATGIAMVR